jgi:hypothetical protein
MRALLVEAGCRLLRSNDPAAAALRAWAERIAARRGTNVAAVALARRPAGILDALWRDGTTYRALAVKAASAAQAATPDA